MKYEPLRLDPRRPNWPQSELIQHDEIRRAVEEHAVARAKTRRAVDEVAELERHMPAAQGRDREALADALVAGRRDPGTMHRDQLAARIENARRHADAHKLNEERAFKVLRTTFADHQDEWISQLDDELRLGHETFQTALTDLIAQHETIAMHASMLRFARGRDQRFWPRSPDSVVLGRQDVAVADLLAALTTYAPPQTGHPATGAAA